MAVTKSDQSTKIVLRVEKGVKPDGSTVYASRTLSHMNPVLSDEDLYDIGAGLGTLQTCPVGDIIRHDTATLARA